MPPGEDQAAAVAPVAAVTLGASAAYTALLGQIGAIGAGHFGALLSETANRLRRRTPQPSAEQWREAVAEALAPVLAASDERAQAHDQDLVGASETRAEAVLRRVRTT
ncbi:hypothetical protein K1W54_26125 [Micromonospora sp. CPCC 205371]|nr:hypothetical protein [Micromonospora sp. CPCC 205371]